MLRWIVFLAAVCIVSAVLGLGVVMPVHSGTQGLFFTLTALSAALLISSFDAFETAAISSEADEDA